MPGSNRLVAVFALFSLLAFAVVGTILHQVGARNLTKQHEDFLGFHAVVVSQSIFQRFLEPSDLGAEPSEARAAEVAAFCPSLGPRYSLG